MELDEADPVPLTELERLDDQEARRHAVAVDAWLGLRIEDTERGLPGNLGARTGQQLWQHVPVQTMLTPYLELRALVHALGLASGTVVDLGAGYGRLGFVVGRYFPGLEFVGYEIVLDRVLEARRALEQFAFPRVRMECADLASRVMRPCDADAYFIYDYGTRDAIEKTLADLQKVARRRAIAVIGRGRAIRDAIERRHPWLTEIAPPRHGKNASTYRSRA